MKNDSCSRNVSIDDVWQIAIRQLVRLRTRRMLGTDVSSELHDLDALLESLPISTSEFGLARNRLRNALRYIEHAERAAAQYELKLLENNLRSWADALTTTYRPQRGIRIRETAIRRMWPFSSGL